MGCSGEEGAKVGVVRVRTRRIKERKEEREGARSFVVAKAWRVCGSIGSGDAGKNKELNVSDGIWRE